MVILGDAGINFTLDESDTELKRHLSSLPITLFCIHGNHEERPYKVPGYELADWHGAKAYVQPEFPSLVFAKDGEIYDLNGKKTVVLGGAYSVDKPFRIRYRYPWFRSEQPDSKIKKYAEEQLEKTGWKVDCVFSHTVPLPYEPTWAFLSSVDQSKVDKSTEEWLDSIEKRLTYDKWYAGHYHVSSQEGPIRILYEDYVEF